MSTHGDLARAERGRDQIAAEIEEEIATHLALAERDLRASGAGEAEAAAGAAERFGDRAAVRRACMHIAEQERIMLQRVNLALIVVVGLALGWGVYSTGSVQARNSEALAAMAQKLDVMAGSGRGVVPVTAEPARPSAVVYLSGNVSNPGAFNMSDETFTVRRLLAAAGAGAAPGRVAIRGADGTLRAELSGPELAAVDGRDVPLLANDTVVVE